MQTPTALIRDMVLKQLAASTSPAAKAELLVAIMELNSVIAKEVKNDVDAFGASTLGNAFDLVIEKTFELEGGWSSSNSDPGGMTMYGISSRFHPTYAAKIKNKTLTIAEAKKIYRSEYWDDIYKIDSIPVVIAWIVFDAKVHGSKESIIDLQKWIKDNTNPNVTTDGVFGPNTWKGIPTSKDQLLSLIAYLEKNTRVSARLAAMRVMRYQKENGLVVKDYTAGFEARFEERYAFGKSLVA